MDQDLYSVLWKQGLERALVEFCDGLHWLYIIILSTTFYGMQHTRTLDWFINLRDNKWWKRNVMWFAGVIVMTLFVIFRFWEHIQNPVLRGTLDPNTKMTVYNSRVTEIDSIYLSAMLRSFFFTVIFSSIFVNIPVYVVKGFGKFIDTKTGTGNKEDKKKVENE